MRDFVKEKTVPESLTGNREQQKQMPFGRNDVGNCNVPAYNLEKPVIVLN